MTYPKTASGNIPLFLDHHAKDGYFWDGKEWHHETVTWEDVDTFHAVLKFDRFEQNSNGTVCVWWRNVMTDATYPMNQHDFKLTMSSASFQETRGAIIDGLWQVRKAHNRYSIQPVTK